MKGTKEVKDWQEASVDVSVTPHGIMLKTNVKEDNRLVSLGVLMNVEETITVALALLDSCPKGALNHKDLDRMLKTLNDNRIK